MGGGITKNEIKIADKASLLEFLEHNIKETGEWKAKLDNEALLKELNTRDAEYARANRTGEGKLLFTQAETNFMIYENYSHSMKMEFVNQEIDSKYEKVKETLLRSFVKETFEDENDVKERQRLDNFKLTENIFSFEINSVFQGFSSICKEKVVSKNDSFCKTNAALFNKAYEVFRSNMETSKEEQRRSALKALYDEILKVAALFH